MHASLYLAGRNALRWILPVMVFGKVLQLALHGVAIRNARAQHDIGRNDLTALLVRQPDHRAFRN